MKRKALIISNPGETGVENYCEGVKVDIQNYVCFIESPLGEYRVFTAETARRSPRGR